MTTLQRYFLEPISALTHLVGAVASLVGTIPLAYLAREQPGKLLTMLIYSLSMVVLYAASALFHGLKTDATRRMWLNRFDHVAIFLLIAGTYTPIAYTLFPDPWRLAVLGLVWSVVIIGGGYKLLGRTIHGLWNTSIYVILGWGSAAPLLLATNLIALVPIRGLLLVLLGGLVYTTGFLVYYFRWPDPWPEVFGHHELWHLFVMGGSLCHYLFILVFVAL